MVSTLSLLDAVKQGLYLSPSDFQLLLELLGPGWIGLDEVKPVDVGLGLRYPDNDTGGIGRKVSDHVCREKVSVSTYGAVDASIL